MKVLVYEHVSGGGYTRQPIPLNILAEGFGMLRGIITDFKKGGHKITVLLDARISKLNPPIDADFTVPITYPQEPKKFITNISKSIDAIYIIAPETGQILQSFVELAEKSGKFSLNCESSAIAKVADKAELYKTLAKDGFQTPKTIILSRKDSANKVKELIKGKIKFPIVIKPVDGIGCGGLSNVKEETLIGKAIAKVKAESASKHFIAQEYVQGKSTSVSLLSNGKKAFALSLNQQNVTLSEPSGVSSYDGGVVPFDHFRKHQAFNLAQKVVESIHGLRGYVGVDLVFDEKRIFVVDVNPRLTTSFVGLREVAGFNVAQTIINSVLKNEFPANNEIKGFSYFSKIETLLPSITAFQKTIISDKVISPPFPLNETNKTYSLLLGKGKSLKNAYLQLEEAKKSLFNIIS